MEKHQMRGITLMELMVVIAIIGVLLSIAALSMGEFVSRTKLRMTLYEIDAAIRQARWIAQGTATICLVKFDTISQSYTINDTQYAKLPDGIKFGVHSDVTGCPNDPYSPPPPDGLSFGSSGHRNTLLYYPTGAVVPAGTVYITDGKLTLAVRVARTGRPKLWQAIGGNRWLAI